MWNISRHPVAIVCILYFAGVASAATPAAGRWAGFIALPGQKLEIQITLVEGGGGGGPLTGKISIPAQGARDLALEKLSAEGAQVTFAIVGIPGEPTFVGELSGDAIAGKFTQGGGTFPFELARKADAATESAALLDGYSEWLDATREAWNVPGVAVGIVRAGEVIFAKGSGLRDIEAKRPVTEKTLFAIGSATKAFTTAVMGTLADEGKLEWDKPVRTIMPEFALQDASAGERITPRDLVTHRSGLPRHDLMWYNSVATRAEVVSRLRYLEPSADLRQKFQYNNLAFITAGCLVEKITGTTWEEQVRSRLLGPLGMSRTNLSVADSQKDDDFAQAYQRSEGVVSKMAFRDISLAGPAGSINSSVEDMLKWVRLHLSKDGVVDGKAVLSGPMLEQLHRPVMIVSGEDPESGEIPIGYALGWFVDVYRGHRRVHHGGNIDGFSALVLTMPEDDIGMVVLTNLNATPLPDIIAKHTIDRLLALPARDWSGLALAKRAIAEKAAPEAAAKKKTMARVAGTTPSHELAAYAGEYEHPGYGVIGVTSTNSGLESVFNRIRTPLEHWHYDTFVCGKTEADSTFEGQQVLFRAGINGGIEELVCTMDPSVKPIVFTRRADAGLRDPALLARLVGVYQLESATATVTLRGTTLSVTVQGQPTFELLPTRDATFDLKGLSGFRARFTLSETGPASEITFLQPNGVFTAKRKGA